ncbi:hypothetical protein C5167_047454 [Papaver somniferum]|uniref:RRM domain-containing protein n=1 Tax=Papaver somniferum TaxID=3469 RepID=A0A4Y7LI59_PAPSO|nr:hypothetical protein C5167_047454 [Papaver somniferum]
MQNQLTPIHNKTSSLSSTTPKPSLIDNNYNESQNPTKKLEISNNGSSSSSRQLFDLNEPCYISSEEEKEQVKDKLVEISQDKHVIKNKIDVESINNKQVEIPKQEEEEDKPIISTGNNKKQKEYEVFVGGLDRDADEDDLMDVFKRVGEVIEVRLVKSKYSNKNKGFAFVRFASVELAKKAAAELNYTLIRGKVCEVTRNNDNETLHLGNICMTWTKDMLVEKLKSYDLENLEQVDLIDDPNESGRNRGYAFLSFSTHMDAVAACSKLHKLNPHFGKSVRADIAFAKSAVEPDEDVMAQVKSVFLDGLPDDWDETTVYNHLKKYGEIVNVTLAHSMPSAKRKDFGFINFSTREAALACIDGVNKDGVGDGANKLLLKASLRKPLRKRTMVMGGWRGNSSRTSYERGFGSSYTSRPSRSIQSPSQDRDRRFVSRYSRREEDYEREASPPAERSSSQFRRASVRQVPTQTHAPSRSRETYYEGRSSSRRSSANYQDLSTSYCQIPSQRRYAEDFYDTPLEYYEDDAVEEFDHPTPSRYKRPYAYEDDERLVSRPLTRSTRARWSELEADDYAEHDVSSNMPDDRIVYETRGRASQYVPRSGASRSYYY